MTRVSACTDKNFTKTYKDDKVKANTAVRSGLLRARSQSHNCMCSQEITLASVCCRIKDKDVAGAMQALQNGTVSAAFTIYADFLTYKSGRDFTKQGDGPNYVTDVLFCCMFCAGWALTNSRSVQARNWVNARRARSGFHWVFVCTHTLMEHTHAHIHTDMRTISNKCARHTQLLACTCTQPLNRKHAHLYTQSHATW
jgi:hypothetical protein